MLAFAKDKAIKAQKKESSLFGRKNFKTLVPFFGCIFVAVLFIVWTGGAILSLSNLEIIFNQVFTVIMIGSGAIFVYAYGGVDLSVGSVVGVISLVIALMTRAEYSPFLALFIAIIIGVVCQVLLGYSAASFKIPLIIISLGFQFIWTGILQFGVKSSSNMIYLPSAMSNAWSAWPVRMIGLVIVVGVMWFLFAKTRLGKYSVALGGSNIVSNLCGINVKRQIVIAHILFGITIGVASMFAVTRASMATAASGGGLGLLIMEALILGGIPVNGGRGSRMFSVFIGAFIIAILENGFLLVGVSQFAIEGITGALFIIVLTLSFKRIKGAIIV